MPTTMKSHGSARFRRAPGRAWAVGLALAVLVALGLPRGAMAAPGDPLLDYGVDLVTDYVSRGQDFFTNAYDRRNKAHGAFHLAPAVQPYFTLHGPAGLSFGVWSSWALQDRKRDPATGVPGLQKEDEIDYNLAWDWSNKLGAFSAGIYAYTFGPDESASNELFLRWSPPVLEALSPTFTRYVVPDAGGGVGGGSTYDLLEIGGGERVTWKVGIGETHKLQDVTGSLGLPLGPVSVSLSATYRPNPELASGPNQVSPYDENGHYVVNGVTHSYPATIFWLTLSYSGSVTQ